VVPSDEELRLLALEPGSAAFSVERLGQHGDRSIEWRVTLLRGDRYRFFADWAPTARSGLTLGPHG
jgi:GntR family transcriptional regulator